jgi:Fic family protein
VVFEPIKGYNWLMSTYNWQQPDWPEFSYDLSGIQSDLYAFVEKSGLINGKWGYLTKSTQAEAIMSLMVEEAVKTSEIEGEYISRPDIRSSIANKLGLNTSLVSVRDRRAQGIADLMLDVRSTFSEPLSEEKLFDWHLMLFAGATDPDLRVGCWRTHNEAMQIVSGHHDKWTVHYEAPPSQRIPKEMQRFIKWFNDTAPGQINAIKFPVVRAAIAHLYFESIHPFEDGNGRIGRAIAEKALSQEMGHPVLLSLSQAIEIDKKSYYAALNAASKSNEVTSWIDYFVNVVIRAQDETQVQINFIIAKSRFFELYNHSLNERQLKVIQKMMQAGLRGFEGGMSAKKYMTISGTSKATATRDLQHLYAIHAFKQIGSGRNVRYELNLELDCLTQRK